MVAGEDLRRFHSGPDGAYGSFKNVDDALGAEGKALGFAMNAGMYHRDLAPVGLYVEDGVEVSKLITSDGPGNFGLLPNGVFCIADGFRVIESRAFKKEHPACRYATHLIALRDGKIVAEGAPKEIVSAELIERIYGLRCTIIEDPVAHTPLVVPLGRK